MLGDTIYEKVLTYQKNINDYLSGRTFDIETLEVICEEKLLDYLKKEDDNKGGEFRHKIYFKEFFSRVTNYGLTKLKKSVKREVFTAKNLQDFREQLAIQLQTVCIRTLITRLHLYKEKEKLRGETPIKEYNYFCEKYVSTFEFVYELFEIYPVLYRIIEEKIENFIKYYIEIFDFFEKDKKQIGEKICGGKLVKKIEEIDFSLSDSHKSGKRVAKLKLDNGMWILYKPRAMKNDEIYMQLIQWISHHIGMKQYEYPFLTYEEHSWTYIVEQSSCNSEKELENYYVRFGIHLFLTYLLGAQDLHYENIIAAGEYPVIIDLEAVSGIPRKQKGISIDEIIYHQLVESVWNTGLLPFCWGTQRRKGVECSGINGKGGQKYLFKIPVVVEGGTSNMHIEYMCPTSEEKQNLPKIKEEFIDISHYKVKIKEGFCKAYHIALQRKQELYCWVTKLKKCECRCFMEDTQRYGMLLFSSYHPQLLKDGAEREIFLQAMWDNRNKNDYLIVDSEVKELLRGDIPFFSFHMDSKNLLLGNGGVISNYFMNTPIELLYQKVRLLNIKDMEKQCEYIDISFDILQAPKQQCVNKVYKTYEKKVDCSVVERNNTANSKLLDMYIERLLKYKVFNYDNTEISWYTIQLEDQYGWSVKTMNIYLYDGLAGMFLISCFLQKYQNTREIAKINKILQSTLFHYTEKGYESMQNLQSQNVGAYEGESSILLTYLIAYQYKKEKIYLDYAKKHIKIIEQLIQMDTNYDVLKGNAGAVLVLLKLYGICPEKKYLVLAEKAVDRLQERALYLEHGVGWEIEKQVPMAGMAHGNSGILMAFVGMWKKTNKRKYFEFAKKILDYEDFLYDPSMGNWKDMRIHECIQDNVGAIAWCHGVSGILWSRMYCYAQNTDTIWRERIKTDMFRAYQKLVKYWRRDSWSLCHGNCGNLLVLEKAKTFFEECSINEKYIFMKEDITLLPQEKMNPGLFNGYGGIIYYMLKKQDKNIPDIFL